MRKTYKAIATLLAISLFLAEPITGFTAYAGEAEEEATARVAEIGSETEEVQTSEMVEETQEAQVTDAGQEIEGVQNEEAEQTLEESTTATDEAEETTEATVTQAEERSLSTDAMTTDEMMTQEMTVDAQTNTSATAGVTLTHLKVTEQDTTKGTFHVEVKGLQAKNGISKVQIPIWSESGGQDDIVWYTATKWSEGTYYVDVKASNHKYATGTYQIHLYVTDGKGIQSYITEITTTVTMASPKVTASLNSAQTTCTITAENIRGDATKVYIPAWSEKGGQNDLKWYEAKKVGSGKWQVSVPMSTHKSWGTYQAHVYATIGDKQSLQCRTTFTVDSPTYTHLKVTKQDNTKGTFHVEVKGLQAKSGISKVQLPIWSESGGQDDLVWYTATKWSTGTYYVDVNVSNHKYSNGVYNIHLYVTDNTGAFGLVAETTGTMKMASPKLTATVNADQTSCTLTAENVYSAVKKVYIPTWSEGGGQDDLKWYEAKKVSTGKWQVTVPISNHKTAGTYQSHLYMKDAKNQTLLAKTTFTIDPATATKLTITTRNTTTGDFHVELSGVSAKSGIQTVQIPVWSEVNGQDDLNWYMATKWSEGVYYVDVKTSNHNGLGTYQVHAYVTGKNGVRNLVQETTTTVNASNYLTRNKIAEGQYKVTVQNLSVSGNVTKVQFPVWSNTKGQDDIIWYTGSKNSDGSWSATVNTRNHADAGLYHAHAYATVGSKQIYLGKTTFTVTASEVMTAQEQRVYQDREAIYAQAGRDLRSCYNWCVNNISYRSVSNTIPSGYTTSQWFAVVGYEQRAGHCYVYAAAFHQLALGLGYDSHFVMGYVPNYSGGLVTHGWVEININGTNYIFDPDFQHETGGNGYQFLYGTSGTWRYTNGTYVS